MRDETKALFGKLEAIGDLTEQMRSIHDALPLQLSTVEKGEEVASEGEITDQSCLLIEGFMHRSTMHTDGNRQILSLQIAGDIPDLQSLHLKKMDHTLTAMTMCGVAFIQHNHLKKALHASPSLADLLWRDTLIDAAGFRAWMLLLGQAQAEERMAHLFCELFVRMRIAGLTSGRSFPLPLRQADLGDVLGISNVHANRTLQALRARNLVQVEAGFASIHNFDALRRHAQFDPAYLHYHDEDRAASITGKLGQLKAGS